MAATPLRLLDRNASFHVEMIGHATLAVRSGGRILLTDPWLLDPMGCNGEYHYPPLVHDAEAVAAATDAIYVSHIHPDHFHRPSLELFGRDVPIYIGRHERKRFRDDVAALGFEVIEVPFQQPVPVRGTDMTICILEHDADEAAAFDSSLLVQAPDFALFENNDCILASAKYEWVRERCDVDYAFLGYSPVSFFPIGFEMPEAEKDRLMAENERRRYGDFVASAALLQARLTVPFANDARFFLAQSLWKNRAFGSGTEAAALLAPTGLRAEVMGPGDRILCDGSVAHVAPVLEREAELRAIAEHAGAMQAQVLARRAPRPAPAPDLVDRFRDLVLSLWRQKKDALPGIRGSVIAYVLRGPQERSFHFDFSRDDDHIFGEGIPPRYDMRYTYPAEALQMRLDGTIEWDELHFTEDVSVHQVRYARDYYRMLRSSSRDRD